MALTSVVMDGETKAPIALEIAHILILDVVGYSKLSTAAQNAIVAKLNELVQESETIRAEEKSNRVLKIPPATAWRWSFTGAPKHRWFARSR